MPVVIGALKEVAPDESRVALVPEVAGKFAALGARLMIERGAGEAAQFPDSAFKNTELFADCTSAAAGGRRAAQGPAADAARDRGRCARGRW